MPSLKSKVFNTILRNRHIFKLKFRKPVFDFNTSIEQFRKDCEEGANRFGTVPEEVKVIKDTISNINVEWLIPNGASSEKIIMYVHGGGYVSGSCNDHRAIVSKFAKQCMITNLTYDYRLAPEYPFPHGLNDSVNVYKELLQKYDPKNIIIAGESAGGGLTLALLLALKEQNIPLPKATVSISPWTDLKCSGESYKTKNSVSLAPLNSWTVFSKYYVGNDNPENPLISPLYGDLSDLPPIYINAGTDDELYDDSQSFYLKAQKAGVNITFKSGEGMVHCYPLLSPMFPEATEAMNEIIKFIQYHLN